MPVRRGHVAPKTTLIETIIRKFDTHRIWLGFVNAIVYRIIAAAAAIPLVWGAVAVGYCFVSMRQIAKKDNRFNGNYIDLVCNSLLLK